MSVSQNLSVCMMNPFLPILPFLTFNHDLLWCYPTSSLCGFLTIALLLWAFGYIAPYQEDDYEMRLPRFVKLFYGKTNRPLGLRGFFSQTLGLVLAIGYLIEFLASMLDQPILVSAGLLFILCIFLIGVPGLIQITINHKRSRK